MVGVRVTMVESKESYGSTASSNGPARAFAGTLTRAPRRWLMTPKLPTIVFCPVSGSRKGVTSFGLDLHPLYLGGGKLLELKVCEHFFFFLE